MLKDWISLIDSDAQVGFSQRRTPTEVVPMRSPPRRDTSRPQGVTPPCDFMYPQHE